MADYKPTQKEMRQYMIDARRAANGDVCDYCLRPFKTLQKIYGKDFMYRREHADGDASNWDFENVRIGCNSCNQRKRPDFQQPSGSTGNSVCVNTEGIEDESDVQKSRKILKIKRAAPEIEINRESEPKVRTYLWQNISRTSGLFIEDAANESSEFAGCNQVTAMRIINRMASRVGPFMKRTAPGGEEFLVLRPGYAPRLDTWTGRIDNQLMQEQLENLREAKTMAEQGVTNILQREKDAQSQNDLMAKTLARVGNERDSAIQKLKEITGLPHDKIMDLLSGKASPSKTSPGVG